MATLVLVFVTMGCAAPRTVVIDDDDEHTEEVLAAIDELEQRAGCRFFEQVRVADLSDRWPNVGETLVRRVPRGSDVLRETGGRAYWYEDGKCRVYWSEGCTGSCIAHELLHCLGATHGGTNGDVMFSPITGWGGIPTELCL